MTHNPSIHRRRNIRLSGYDYAQAGMYFVTVCTQNRACLFGEILDGEIRLNEAGHIVQEVWNGLPMHYANVQLDVFMIMPNHVHGIIAIMDVDNVGADLHVGTGLKPVPTKNHGLPEIVRAFKTFSSRSINVLRGTPGLAVWQRNYYEQIIRDEVSLAQIRQYIINNPLQWALDRENPANATGRAQGEP